MDYHRGNLKRSAKQALKSGSFWTGFGVNVSLMLMRIVSSYLISLLISAGFLGVFGGLFKHFGNQLFHLPPDRFANQVLEITKEYILDLGDRWIWLLISQVLVFVLGALITVFLFNILSLGRRRWYVRNREQAGPARFSHLFDFFSAGHYQDGLVGYFRYDLQMFLWSLPLRLGSIGFSAYCLHWIVAVTRLVAVSGNRILIETQAQMRMLREMAMELLWVSLIFSAVMIVGAILISIKHYALGLAPWLLADNPHLDPSGALRLSKRMMRGLKWHRFVLDLSFIGYYLLLIVLFPLFLITGSLFSVYWHACDAEFYAMARDKAHNEGILRMEDLGYFKRVQEEPLSATAFYSERPY